MQKNIRLVVGVPRSGALAGSLFALRANLPYIELPSFLNQSEGWTGFREGHGAKSGSILVIDDSCDSGREMARVRSAIASAFGDTLDVIFGAVYVTPNGRGHVDTYHSVVPQPRAFEWNVMHHESVLAHTCMDIDGILCVDPSPQQNDDGVEYRRFLNSAQKIYAPDFLVDSLVTSRLEKYRTETEDWLASSGVRYRRLYMLDLPSAAERQRLSAHATHKAEVYSASNNWLFIESSMSEAAEIHKLSERPVYVPTTGAYFGDGAYPDFREPVKSRLERSTTALKLRGVNVARRLLGKTARRV